MCDRGPRIVGCRRPSAPEKGNIPRAGAAVMSPQAEMVFSAVVPLFRSLRAQMWMCCAALFWIRVVVEIQNARPPVHSGQDQKRSHWNDDKASPGADIQFVRHLVTSFCDRKTFR